MIIDPKTKCIKIEVVKIRSKKTQKVYQAISVSIGNDELPVQFLHFCPSPRDLAYVKQVLDYVAKNN
jgi:hypothetical protein